MLGISTCRLLKSGASVSPCYQVQVMLAESITHMTCMYMYVRSNTDDNHPVGAARLFSCGTQALETSYYCKATPSGVENTGRRRR